MQAYSVAALTGGAAGEGFTYLLTKVLSENLKIHLGLQFHYYQTGSMGHHEEGPNIALLYL